MLVSILRAELASTKNAHQQDRPPKHCSHPTYRLNRNLIVTDFDWQIELNQHSPILLLTQRKENHERDDSRWSPSLRMDDRKSNNFVKIHQLGTTWGVTFNLYVYITIYNDVYMGILKIKYKRIYIVTYRNCLVAFA
jgi:hypothetical protein